MRHDGWQIISVGDLVAAGALAVNDGYRVTNRELGTAGTPFVRGGDIGDGWIATSVADHIRPEFQDRITKKLSQPDDVAFITKGTVGRVGYLRPGQPNVVFAPQVCFWRVLDGAVLNSRFLFYLLRSSEFQSNLNAVKTHGSMVADYVSLSDQRAFRLRIPPIQDQRAIASILGSLDDKIELNRRTNRTLEQMAAAIFKAWFVDFEPVKAKAAGAKSFPSMPQAVFDSLPTTFVDSPLGPIPKGWHVGRVSDIASLSKVTIDPRDHTSEVFDHFSIPAFDEGQIPKRESGEEIKSNKFEVRPGCVLISKLNPRIPRVWLPPSSGGCRQIASTEFLVCVPNDVGGREYLFGLASTQVFQENLAARVTGTSGSHQRVKPDDLLMIEIVTPPAKAITAYAVGAQSLLSLIEANRASSQTLAAIRDTLLPRLLSGEIRLGAAEAGSE